MKRFSPVVFISLLIASAIFGLHGFANEGERGVVAPAPQQSAQDVTTITLQRLADMDSDEFEYFAEDWSLIYSRASPQGRIDFPLHVPGFSRIMLGNILVGGWHRPLLFRGLIRDLMGTTDRDERLRILNNAKMQLEEEIELRQASSARIRAELREPDVISGPDHSDHGLWSAIAEEDFQTWRAEKALEVLEIWVEFPMEGALP